MSLETFKEIQRRVQQKIQNDDTSTTDLINDFLPKCKVWINDAYERLLMSKPWQEIMRQGTLSIVASTSQYALNRDVWQITKLFDVTNGYPLDWITQDEYIMNRASTLDQAGNIITGDPVAFFMIGEYTAQNDTPSAEKITVVSSSTSDTSPATVEVRGLVSGVEIQETIILNGTTSVESSNTYDSGQILSIHIGSNDGSQINLVGVVSVTGSTSATVYSKIAPRSQATQYQWIQVTPTPPSTGTMPTINIYYRRRFPKLVNNSDMPLFDCTQAVVQGAYAIALEEDGQDATIAKNEFVNLVEELWASKQNPNKEESFQMYNRGTYAALDFNRQVILP